MTATQRIIRFVDALPLEPEMRVLEIGCGPGVAARLVAERVRPGFVLAIDRSEKAIGMARKAVAMDDPHLRFMVMAAEDLILPDGMAPFDLVFAQRVGALDGRHPALGERVLERLAGVMTPSARLFIDTDDDALPPLREIVVARRT